MSILRKYILPKDVWPYSSQVFWLKIASDADWIMFKFDHAQNASHVTPHVYALFWKCGFIGDCYINNGLHNRGQGELEFSQRLHYIKLVFIIGEFWIIITGTSAYWLVEDVHYEMTKKDEPSAQHDGDLRGTLIPWKVIFLREVLLTGLKKLFQLCYDVFFHPALFSQRAKGQRIFPIIFNLVWDSWLSRAKFLFRN